MIICNPDTVAYFYTEEDIFPYKRYKSGTLEGQEGIYSAPTLTNPFPLLILENDIINSQGYGLKKGFYEIRPDETLDFLLIYEAKMLKAKVPVLSVEQINKNPKKKEKISTKRKKKKYKKGESPDDVVFSNVEIKYDEKNNCYMIFWEYSNTRIIGIMKMD
jgi:hypothetical protein